MHQRKKRITTIALITGLATASLIAGGSASAKPKAPHGVTVSTNTGSFRTMLVVGSGRFAGFSLYFISSDQTPTYGCTTTPFDGAELAGLARGLVRDVPRREPAALGGHAHLNPDQQQHGPGRSDDDRNRYGELPSVFVQWGYDGSEQLHRGVQRCMAARADKWYSGFVGWPFGNQRGHLDSH